MDFYISEQEVREKIPDMTGRKRRRPAQKSLFHAELMDFLFFHADQQKMFFRHKGRTETFRGSTEFYGAVRRGTERYGEIRYLIFAAVAMVSNERRGHFLPSSVNLRKSP